MAFSSGPPSRARSSGMADTMAWVARMASMSSATTATSPTSVGLSRSMRAEAGMWWRAADTSAWGAAFWTAWAIDPSSMRTGSKFDPTRRMALAIDTTTFPASRGACSAAVATVALAVVPSTTISAASATSALDAGSMWAIRGPHRSTSCRTVASALAGSRDPAKTRCPSAARRAARPLPAGPVAPRMPIFTSERLQVEPCRSLTALRGDGVDVALPEDQVLVAPDLHLVAALGGEQHPVVGLHVADGRPESDHLAPHQAPVDVGGGRDQDPAARLPLAGLLRRLDQQPVGGHADGLLDIGPRRRIPFSHTRERLPGQ